MGFENKLEITRAQLQLSLEENATVRVALDSTTAEVFKLEANKSR